MVRRLPEAAPRVRRAQIERVVVIDVLIHRFHEDLDGGNKPGAYDLIEGDPTDVAAFLGRITYGPDTPGDVVERREAWRRRVGQAPRFWREQLAGPGVD